MGDSGMAKQMIFPGKRLQIDYHPDLQSSRCGVGCNSLIIKLGQMTPDERETYELMATLTINYGDLRDLDFNTSQYQISKQLNAIRASGWVMGTQSPNVENLTESALPMS